MGLDVMDWNDLRECSQEELYELLNAYDDYIAYAFEDWDKIKSGWTPVSVLEFANSEEFENMRGAL